MRTLRSVVVAFLLGASSVQAQESDTLVLAGSTIEKAVANHDQGFPAYPITLLQAFGGEFTNSAGRIEIQVLGTVLGFRPGLGTFTVNGTIFSLHELSFVQNGMLYLPRRFFVQWMPTRYSRQVRYNASTSTLATLEFLTRNRQQAAPRPVVKETTAPAGGGTLERAGYAGEDLPPRRATIAPARSSAPGIPTALEMHLRVSGSYSDNFFQAPDDAAATELLASTIEARMLLRTGRRRLNVHARANRTSFDGFEPSLAVGGGVDWTVGPHNLEATVGSQRRSPRLMAGDQAGFADLDHAAASYGMRLPGALEISALGQYYDIYLHATQSESRFYGAGGSAQFRGFGYQFTPEVGRMRSRWKGPSVAGDYDEQTDWVALRMVPVAPMYLYVRYRQETRSYVVPDPAAGNFGRGDARRHWTASLDLRVTRRVGVGVYYTREDVSSTRAGRGFASQSLTSSLSYRLW